MSPPRNAPGQTVVAFALSGICSQERRRVTDSCCCANRGCDAFKTALSRLSTFTTNFARQVKARRYDAGCSLCLDRRAVRHRASVEVRRWDVGMKRRMSVRKESIPSSTPHVFLLLRLCFGLTSAVLVRRRYTYGFAAHYKAAVRRARSVQCGAHCRSVSYME